MTEKTKFQKALSEYYAKLQIIRDFGTSGDPTPYIDGKFDALNEAVDSLKEILMTNEITIKDLQ